MTPRPPTEYEAAILALRADGIAEDAARAVLRVSPPESLAALSKKGLDTWADAQTAQAAQEYAESPAGRQEAARALIAAEQEQAARLAEADAIMRSRGLSAADVASLDADLKLRITGVAEVAPAKRVSKLTSSMIREGGAPASAEELAMLAESDASLAERGQS
jgi:hypothetical protein